MLLTFTKVVFLPPVAWISLSIILFHSYCLHQVGVVSDEKLLELLELAMSSETAETVKRARELMDSGVDPMVLMSQLAGLIMDIIAGSYTVIDDKPDGSFFGGRSCKCSICFDLIIFFIFVLFILILALLW